LAHGKVWIGPGTRNLAISRPRLPPWQLRDAVRVPRYRAFRLMYEPNEILAHSKNFPRFPSTTSPSRRPCSDSSVLPHQVLHGGEIPHSSFLSFHFSPIHTPSRQRASELLRPKSAGVTLSILFHPIPPWAVHARYGIVECGPRDPAGRDAATSRRPPGIGRFQVQ